MRRFGLFALTTVAVVAIALVAGWRSWADILAGPLLISTQKVSQVTGDQAGSGITGTDLGSPVQWRNQLYFFFGDSRDTDPSLFIQKPHGFDAVAVGHVNWDIQRDHCLVAVGPDITRDGCATLVYKTDGTTFRPIQLEERLGVTPVTRPLGVFETPISGVVSEDSLYVFFTQRNALSPGCTISGGCALGDPGPAGGQTVLGRATDDGVIFHKVSDVSTGKFQWPVAVPQDIRTIPGLADQIGLHGFTGQVAVIFATGREDYAFRHGYPFLAVVPLQEIWMMEEWQYFSGIVNGKPEFKKGEGNAVPLPPFGHETAAASGQPPPPDLCVENQCGEIRKRIARLEENIAGLKADMIGATGSLLHGIAGHLNDALNQLAREQEALAECEKPPPPYHKCVGELSVAYIEQWGKWAMLYSCGACPDRSYNRENIRGIYLRTADVPWGPWSGPKLIFSPSDGYCYFMYSAEPCGANQPNPRDEGMRDPNGQVSWGGEYAPMLLPTYTKVEGDTTSLYFLMSTWNPYQVVLMRTVIRPRSSLRTRVVDIFSGIPRQE